MSEIKSELDEMEQQSYSINSNNMDPKNNEELIIYVSFPWFVYIIIIWLIILGLNCFCKKC